MASLQFIRDDFKLITRSVTYCKFKGHTVSRKTVVDTIGNKNEMDIKCERCGWQLRVRRIPDDPDHFIVSEV